jgi:hypothetical protein
MALSADKKTQMRAGDYYVYPCAASKTFYKGAVVVLDSSGNAEPATAATGKICVGIAEESKTSTVAAAETIKVRVGEFLLENSGSDPVTKADIGSVVYTEDDETVAKTSGTNSVVGYMTDISSDGVWVKIHAPANANPSGACLTANNLSDVTAADARENIGADEHHIAVRISNLVAADAKVYGLPAPVAGDITAIRTVLNEAALAGGDATITAAIGGVGVTGGVVTITQSGSAVGDVDLASPSAANTVAAGDYISFTVGGANTDTDAFAELIITIED